MVILLLFYLAYPAAIKKGTIMGYRQVNEGCASKAQVEIPTALLAQLISSGMLIGTDCVCLDNNARKIMWQSLLNLSTNLSTNSCTNFNQAEL